MEIVSRIGEYALAAVIVFGTVFCLLGAFGLVRLPDVYLRSHAATKSATLGVLCVLTGVFLYMMLFEHHVSAKLLLGIVFVFLTSPVAGHLNGRAAYRSGVPLWRGSVQDDLQDHIKFKEEQN
ncbi:monovalent cation/H(+) antiporter subunit G [Paenibacillus sp. SYP-B4298]|uniref:monovalent cation/H(+) antiporter subunit G n=1 Tax=Paenibacillus sp. SYP-B4298 TaxID=2996034 RepID=UPI0022DDCEF4|nr:monovalent cation/H(+) antiporter subunit G [Paenibacillus sp. SYP-B4298]